MTDTTSGTTAVRQQRFTDKRVLVTGASGGVGRELAALLRAEGARVVGTDVVAGEGVVESNLADPASITSLAEHALAELGGLDVLCNVAGVQSHARLETLTAESLGLHLAVNTVGPILLTQAVLPALVESGGNVVTVASISAMMGQPYNTAYCASKGGVLLAMRALAIELADKGVRVNCVSPGGIDTQMIEGAANSLPADTNWDLVAKSQGVLPGFMPPADIAEAIMYLASDVASSITGTNLKVDRGVVW